MNTRIFTDAVAEQNKDTFPVSQGDDSLKVTFPARVEGGFCEQLHREIGALSPGAVENIVFDCSCVENVSPAAAVALIRLEKRAQRYGIQLVMLDAPVTLFYELSPLLRDAAWINSYRPLYGQTVPRWESPQVVSL